MRRPWWQLGLPRGREFRALESPTILQMEKLRGPHRMGSWPKDAASPEGSRAICSFLRLNLAGFTQNVLTVGPWTNHFTSLGLSFPIGKMGNDHPSGLD